jgi:hypothetical protein
MNGMNMDALERAAWHGQWIALSNMAQEIAVDHGFGSEREQAAYQMVKDHWNCLSVKDHFILRFQDIKYLFGEYNRERKAAKLAAKPQRGRHRLRGNRSNRHHLQKADA